MIILDKSNAANSSCGTAHSANSIFMESNAETTGSYENNVVMAAGEAGFDQDIAWYNFDGNNPPTSYICIIA